MPELRFAVIVPARGGSKRVPRKNIAPLAGRPLLSYTLEAAVRAGLGGPVLVSTEDDEIATVARSHAGVRVVPRPEALALDAASTEAVLLHVLDVLRSEGADPEWIVTLPPTSPFRTVATIRRLAEEASSDPAAQDCLMSVTENRGDFWRRRPDGSLGRLFPDAPRRQQDREPLYEENSAIYVTRAAVLRATGSILGSRVRGIPIDPIEAFDINTPLDLRMAEALLAAG